MTNQDAGAKIDGVDVAQVRGRIKERERDIGTYGDGGSAVTLKLSLVFCSLAWCARYTTVVGFGLCLANRHEGALLHAPFVLQ